MARRARRQTSTTNPFDAPAAPVATIAPKPSNTRTTNAGGGAKVTVTTAPAAANPFDLGGGVPAPTPTGPTVIKINDGKKVVTPPPPKKRDDPIRRLNIDLDKIKASIPSMSPANQARAKAVIAQQSQGTAFADRQKAMQQATLESFAAENAPGADQATIPGALGALSAAGAVVKQVSRPVQAVTSAYGALARGTHESGTWGPHLGPVALPSFSHVSPHEVTKGFYGGLALNRHDTPSSILRDVATIDRSRSTDPTFARGIDKGVSSVPGGRIAFDTLVGVVSDPLTYLTFGTSSAAKSALEVVEKVTTGEKAALVARDGLDALNAVDRAAVEQWLPEEGLKALERGAQGGIGVRVPFGSETGRTVINTKPATEAIRGAFRAAEGTEGVLGAPARAARTVGATAKDIFVPRADLIARTDIGGESVARDVYGAQAEARGFQHGRTDRLVKRLANVMKAENVTPTEMREIVGPALDVGGTGTVSTGVAETDKRLQNVVDRFREVRQDLTTEQVNRGRLQADSALGPDAIQTENYFPRVRTEQGDALYNTELARQGIGADAVGIQDPFLQARQLRPDMSVRDINAQISSELGKPVEYFHEDPLLAFSERGRSAYGSMAREDFTNSLLALRDPEGNPLVHDLSVPANVGGIGPAPTGGALTEQLAGNARNIPEGHVTVEMTDPLTKMRTTVAVPQEVGELVTKTNALMNDPEAISGLYNSFLNWWKTMATVPLPFGWGFHMRNAESNFILNWMSGMGVSVPDYVRAGTLQRTIGKGIKDFGDWQHYLAPADRSLMQSAFDKEVLSAGWYGDLGEVAKQADQGMAYSRQSRSLAGQAKFAAKRLNPLSTEGIMATGGRRVGQGIEENARLAHFLAAERVTGDTDAAAASVRKWLFDYHDVTGSEQIIKKVVPFYSWARKSTAAVLETLVRDPRKLSQLNRLRDSIAQSANVDLSNTLVPQYDRDNPTAVPIGTAGRGVIGRVLGATQAAGTPLIATPDTPLSVPYDVANMAYGAARAIPYAGKALPNLGPASEPGDAARQLLTMVGGPAGIAKAIGENVAGVNFFSGAPIRDEYVTSPRPFDLLPGQDRMTAATKNLLNAIYPTSTKIEGALPNDPKNKDKQLRRILSMFFGIGVDPIGTNTQQAEAYRRLDPIQRFRKAMQAAGEMPAG